MDDQDPLQGFRKAISKGLETWQSFSLSAVELENLNKWLVEHDKVCTELDPPPVAIVPSRLSYIFTPNSVGCSVTVRCRCGAEQSITDVDSW